MDPLTTWHPVGCQERDVIRKAKELSRMSWAELGIASGWSSSHLQSVAGRRETRCSAQVLLDVLQASGCTLAIGHMEHQ